MLDERSFIGFYHENEEYGCLSNWYPASFEYAGIKYANSEQFMMYQKMRTFGHFDIAEKIRMTTDPQECKKLGRTTISNWDEEFWDSVCYSIVKRGVKAKFAQNPDIRKQLIETGSALLAECSPKDKNWGIGLGIDDSRVFNISEWTGKNYLGRILMEVRDELTTLSLLLPQEKNFVFRDARNMLPSDEWKMTFDELMRIPRCRKVVSDYVRIAKKFCSSSEYSTLMGLSPAKIEEKIRADDSQDIPVQGFWEMKQDLYDTTMNMWVCPSRFEDFYYRDWLIETEGRYLIKMDEAEFIDCVAKDCLDHMTEKDKQIFRENRDSSDYHFGYGMFIRNKYIHTRELPPWAWSYDDLSGEIIDRIISCLNS